MPHTTSGPRAVFISYASQDLPAAQAVADALTAAGIEVWLDRSELRGGDAWDQDIRRRIRECTLFLPIISDTTERRHEGYFRLEWRLADQRTHLMGRSVPFIVPVCIADVDESNADVPDSFLAVHWTRLPGAVPTPQFVERVRALLAGRDPLPRPAAAGGGGTLPPIPAAAAAPAPARRFALPRTLLVALLAAIFGAVLGGYLLISRFRSAVADKSIAVLPFEDISDGTANTFFADGIHEDIITNLNLIKDLRVIPRPSVVQYRNTTKPVREIADELGVSYILRGSVRRSGDRLRITPQLIQAALDQPLWTKPFDSDDTTDVFALQAQIAQEIAAALKTVLTPQAKSLMTQRQTGNLNAYDEFIRVRDAFSRDRATRAWLLEQEGKLKTIVEMDPNFAAAWSLLAIIHSRLVGNSFDTSAERRALAKEAVDNARRIAPESPDTIRSIGVYSDQVLRDYPAAIAQFDKLSQLQPNSGDGPGFIGVIQRQQGKWTEALVNLRTASQVDPGNLSHARALESLLAGGRLFREAMMQRQGIIRLLPNRLDEAYQLGVLEFRGTGDTRGGQAFFDRMTPEQRDSPLGISLRTMWARLTGNYAEAVRLDRLQPHFADDGAPPWPQAIAAGVTLAASGDAPGARSRVAGVTETIQELLENQPSNPTLWQALAQAHLILGNNSEAVAAALRQVALVPAGSDAVAEPNVRYRLAIANAWTGNRDDALEELGRLLKAPFLPATVHTLKFDPWWAPVREDPRFAALLADPQNHAPLFQDPGFRGGRRGGAGFPGGRGPGGPRGARAGGAPGE